MRMRRRVWRRGGAGGSGWVGGRLMVEVHLWSGRGRTARRRSGCLIQCLRWDRGLDMELLGTAEGADRLAVPVVVFVVFVVPEAGNQQRVGAGP